MLSLLDSTMSPSWRVNSSLRVLECSAARPLSELWEYKGNKSKALGKDHSSVSRLQRSMISDDILWYRVQSQALLDVLSWKSGNSADEWDEPSCYFWAFELSVPPAPAREGSFHREMSEQNFHYETGRNFSAANMPGSLPFHLCQIHRLSALVVFGMSLAAILLHSVTDLTSKWIRCRIVFQGSPRSAIV